MGEEVEELVKRLRELDAKRTKTDHGWWTGDAYNASFGPVDDPQDHTTIRLPDAAEDDGMMDVWAGDRNNDADNRPLICECGEPADARFIAAAVNAMPTLLNTIEALRSSLTRVEEERDEAAKAIKPALAVLRFYRGVGEHMIPTPDYERLEDVHARLSRAAVEPGK